MDAKDTSLGLVEHYEKQLVEELITTGKGDVDFSQLEIEFTVV